MKYKTDAEIATRKISDWQHPLLETMYEEGNPKWLQITEEIFWQQLEVLPPIKQNGNSFMVGEPYCWDEKTNCDVHTAFVKVLDTYWCKILPTKLFNRWKAVKEISNQIDSQPIT